MLPKAGNLLGQSVPFSLFMLREALSSLGPKILKQIYNYVLHTAIHILIKDYFSAFNQ